MKRILTLILALALVFALAAPALAEGDESRTTQIKYVVESSYTVTIPSTEITVPTATATVGIAAGSVILPTQKLNVSISGTTYYDAVGEGESLIAAGFKMKNDTGTNIYLSYTVSSSSVESIDKDEVFLTVAADECYGGKTVVLTFTPAVAEHAGTYRDTVTFAFKSVAVTP